MNEITAAGAAEQFTQLADSIDRHYRSATNAQHLAQNLQRAIYHGAKIMLALVDAGILCRKAGTAPWRDRAHFIGATNLGSEHAELTCVWSVSVMSWLREKHPNLVKSDLGIYDFWITKVKDGKAVTDANGEPVSITTDYTPASWLAHNQARADDYILACRAIATILSDLPSTDVEAKHHADSAGEGLIKLSDAAEAMDISADTVKRRLIAAGFEPLPKLNGVMAATMSQYERAFKAPKDEPHFKQMKRLYTAKVTQ